MGKTYRVAVLGLVHDHVWSMIEDFKATGRVELVAAADVNPELLVKVAQDHGISQTYEDYIKLLDEVQVDIAAVCVENNRGHEIVAECAKRGIHVISEKPMAATLAQAEAMLRSAEAADIKLLINWPSAWSPELACAIDMIKRGDIGQVFKIRNVSSHGGPKEIGCTPYFWGWLHDEERNGAGALMDYCCYGAALCTLLLGRPVKATGIRGTYVKDYMQVDDNAVILAGYDKAIGVIEASWTEATHHYVQQFFGTKGDLFSQDGKLILVAPSGTTTVDVPPLAPHKASGPAYLIHCIETGEEVQGLCSPKVSRDAQEILEAGKVSADKGQTINLA